MDRPWTCLISIIAAVGAAALLSGCGASDDAAAKRARHFYSALAAGDGATACADLATEARSSLEQQEEMPCEKAILDQDLPTTPGRESAKVYGSMAQVAHGTETAFLSRYDNGWRLTAVGCTPTGPGAPYDCAIEVG